LLEGSGDGLGAIGGNAGPDAFSTGGRVYRRLHRSPDRRGALHFAQQLVQNQGHVSDEEVAKVRQAGYGDAEIAEIVGHVALNVFTNYFNTVAQTEVDFPKTGKSVAPRS